MRIVYWCIFVTVLSGCNSFNKVKNQLSAASPYERYSHSLEKAGLDKTALGATWKSAGNRVFKDSLLVEIPFSEAGYFSATGPDARSYRFKVKEGQILTIKGTVKAKPGNQVFLDLFVEEKNNWKHFLSADTSLSLTTEFRKDHNCLLRIQPELLINVFFTISVSSTPVLINPVLGASNKSIGSFYGDIREAGARKHEGVDIFAAKGTPVVAPASGYITKVAETRLGGKVIWMEDEKRNHSYYFAHLDNQLVTLGKVSQGDTIGTVGNTGNAKLTPPHLHFGIYQNGSKDPLHYIKIIENTLAETTEDTTVKDQNFRVTGKKAVVHTGPGPDYPVSHRLVKNNYLKVLGYNSHWYRIQLPDYKEGYVARKLISPATKGKTVPVDRQVSLLAEAHFDAVPVKHLDVNETVEVLAEYDSFKYVRDEQGMYGWIHF